MLLQAKVDIIKEVNPAFGSISELINRVLPNLMILGGIITFLLLVGGGFMLIQGAGSGDTEQLSKGKKALTYAIIGLILIFSSYWIIKLVSRVTGVPLL